MLRAEQLLHLRAAAFSSVEGSAAIAKWLDEVIEGALENYSLQAEAALDPESAGGNLEKNLRTMDTDSGESYAG